MTIINNNIDKAMLMKPGWFLHIAVKCDKSAMALIPIMNSMDSEPRCAKFLQILYCRHSVRIFPVLSGLWAPYQMIAQGRQITDRSPHK